MGEGVAGNTMNKQSQGRSFSLGLGMGLTTPHRKEVICYEIFRSASDLD